MKIAAAVARILLGLIFLVFGMNGFLHFLPSPPIPGPGGAFLGALIESHYFYLIAGVQVLCGALLLANQYVPLALALLAPMLANILAFHVTMQPGGLPPAAAAAVLWLIAVFPLRSCFAPLLARKAAFSR